MSPELRFVLIPLVIGLVSGVPGPAQAPKKSAGGPDYAGDPLNKVFDDSRDLTLLRRITERTFVHEAAGISYTVPPGWNEIPPHRLARKIDPSTITVLGIERQDRDLVASLYWIPMNPTQQIGDWVRTEPLRDEYGEEYETLRAVYGKDRVSLPTRAPHGPFEVYRINIQGGPDRGDRYDGTLLAFATDSGNRNWLMKARISYPKKDPRAEEHIKEVLNGYARMPDAPPASSKSPASPVAPTNEARKP